MTEDKKIQELETIAKNNWSQSEKKKIEYDKQFGIGTDNIVEGIYYQNLALHNENQIIITNQNKILEYLKK